MVGAARFRGLDALRGLAILGMSWSGMLPDTLPHWMFHIQTPPPNHDLHAEIFGISWVDLIFPLFLFSMGAAIPLALQRKLDRGESNGSVTLALAWRGLLLASFALFGEHLRPGVWTDSPTTATWGLSLIGFLLIVLMYGSKSEWNPSWLFKGLRGLAWVVATLAITTHWFPSDKKIGFANYRQDVILMVLANVAFAAGVIWIFTRHRPTWRYAIMAAVGLVFLGRDADGSVAKQIWEFTPQQLVSYHGWNQSRFFPIVYHFEYLKYLLVVLPGTFCGELAALRVSHEDQRTAWSGWNKAAIIGIGTGSCVIACIGLVARATVATFWAELALCGCALWLSRGGIDGLQRFVYQCVKLGSIFLMLGLLSEPIGGGIRKDPPTLSYFLTTSGLGFLLIAAIELMLEHREESLPASFLWMSGMNPMVGYVAITNFAPAISALLGYSATVAGSPTLNSPWTLAFMDGGLKTVLVGITACVFTRFRYFLRT